MEPVKSSQDICGAHVILLGRIYESVCPDEEVSLGIKEGREEYFFRKQTIDALFGLCPLESSDRAPERYIPSQNQEQNERYRLEFFKI